VETLAELNPVEVSLVPFLKLNDRYVLSEPYAGKSILLKGIPEGHDRAQAYARLAAILNESRKPVFIHGRDRHAIHHGHAGFLTELAGNREGSFIISPHFEKEELLGMVEIHAPESIELGPEILGRLEPVFSYFELAFRNNITAFRDAIGTLVKEQFTSLQKVVEWKFNEVAWEYLKGKETGAGTDLGSVHFDQVYPLYGAVDVRNSSVERNACTKRDLSEQLLMIGDAVSAMQDQHSLALQDYLENIRFKNNAFLECMKGDIHSEDEIKLNEYLEQEIKSLLRHLSRAGGPAQEHAMKYLQSVDPVHGHLFNHRRRFDQSIGMLNTAIEHFLVREQDKIQQVFPHFFEKFRTDGIEYNIYIGETIVPRRNFDYLHLKNLRLWQLSTMVEIARLTHAMQDSLPLPLQTTQLILLYNNPIAINFRKDEKRFDVEGGANIRYEIIKKRIDKALIRDIGERLTQPGKVAIVFTQGRDIKEYEEYIHFLRNKGSLEDGVEQFELADMQGISGLKALRVTVKKK
jgi:hypothetical protein